ncbi:hypothetical protein GW17_00050104, partial [Ensete ventricosum]
LSLSSDLCQPPEIVAPSTEYHPFSPEFAAPAVFGLPFRENSVLLARWIVGREETHRSRVSLGRRKGNVGSDLESGLGSRGDSWIRDEGDPDQESSVRWSLPGKTTASHGTPSV